MTVNSHRGRRVKVYSLLRGKRAKKKKNQELGEKSYPLVRNWQKSSVAGLDIIKIFF